jgi:putative RNA 2'-phosphotransferase
MTDCNVARNCYLEAMEQRLIKLSKLLSLVLRHNPGVLGLTLDAQGWVAVDDLLAAAQRHGHALDTATLAQIVADNSKQRFAFSPDGTRIRANQGHSIPVELGLEPITPPELLYHGTARHLLTSIRESGLERRSRQHVHLSADTDTATAVGKRHGVPIVLTVAAGAMQAAGFAFYRSANGVWLTDHVPPEYLGFPEGV